MTKGEFSNYVFSRLRREWNHFMLARICSRTDKHCYFNITVEPTDDGCVLTTNWLVPEESDNTLEDFYENTGKYFTQVAQPDVDRFMNILTLKHDTDKEQLLIRISKFGEYFTYTRVRDETEEVYDDRVNRVEEKLPFKFGERKWLTYPV